MAINTYLLTIESKKTNEANKKNRVRIMDMERVFDGCQMGRGCGGMGEEVRG